MLADGSLSHRSCFAPTLVASIDAHGRKCVSEHHPRAVIIYDQRFVHGLQATKGEVDMVTAPWGACCRSPSQQKRFRSFLSARQLLHHLFLWLSHLPKI